MQEKFNKTWMKKHRIVASGYPEVTEYARWLKAKTHNEKKSYVLGSAISLLELVSQNVAKVDNLDGTYYEVISARAEKHIEKEVKIILDAIKRGR